MVLLAVMAGLVLLSGCVETSTVIEVKKDGSGYIGEEVYMSKAFEQMIQQMAAAFGGEQAESPMSTIDEEKCRRKASKMGEGVKFMGAKIVKKNDGRSGRRTVYSFDDITKLKISPDPDTPSGVPGQGPQPGADNKPAPVTFGFVKGSTPRLIINMPQVQETGESDQMEMPETSANPEEMTPQQRVQMEQMKKMMEGFHIRLTVKVDGEIVESNASHVEKNRETGKDQIVTLFDMDIGKLVNDEKNLMKIAGMQGVKDFEKAAEQLKDIPGFKIETRERVEIEFK